MQPTENREENALLAQSQSEWNRMSAEERSEFHSFNYFHHYRVASKKGLFKLMGESIPSARGK